MALEVEPPFHRYVLIERVTRTASELTALKSEFPDRNIEIINDDANDAIAAVCQATSWRGTRGVVLLDPSELQVSWNTLVAIARIGTLDVWILFPSGMGLNCLLTKSGDIPQEWQETLDRSLGTDGWRSAFYRSEQEADLSEGPRSKTIKDAEPGFGGAGRSTNTPPKSNGRRATLGRLRANETVNQALAELNRHRAARAKAGQPGLRDDDRVAQALVRAVEIATERWQHLLAH